MLTGLERWTKHSFLTSAEGLDDLKQATQSVKGLKSTPTDVELFQKRAFRPVKADFGTLLKAQLPQYKKSPLKALQTLKEQDLQQKYKNFANVLKNPNQYKSKGSDIAAFLGWFICSVVFLNKLQSDFSQSQNQELVNFAGTLDSNLKKMAQKNVVDKFVNLHSQIIDDNQFSADFANLTSQFQIVPNEITQSCGFMVSESSDLQQAAQKAATATTEEQPFKPEPDEAFGNQESDNTKSGQTTSQTGGVQNFQEEEDESFGEPVPDINTDFSSLGEQRAQVDAIFKKQQNGIEIEVAILKLLIKTWIQRNKLKVILGLVNSQDKKRIVALLRRWMRILNDKSLENLFACFPELRDWIISTNNPEQKISQKAEGVVYIFSYLITMLIDMDFEVLNGTYIQPVLQEVKTQKDQEKQFRQQHMDLFKQAWTQYPQLIEVAAVYCEMFFKSLKPREVTALQTIGFDKARSQTYAFIKTSSVSTLKLVVEQFPWLLKMRFTGLTYKVVIQMIAFAFSKKSNGQFVTEKWYWEQWQAFIDKGEFAQKIEYRKAQNADDGMDPLNKTYTDGFRMPVGGSKPKARGANSDDGIAGHTSLKKPSYAGQMNNSQGNQSVNAEQNQDDNRNDNDNENQNNNRQPANQDDNQNDNNEQNAVQNQNDDENHNLNQNQADDQQQAGQNDNQNQSGTNRRKTSKTEGPNSYGGTSASKSRGTRSGAHSGPTSFDGDRVNGSRNRGQNANQNSDQNRNDNQNDDLNQNQTGDQQQANQNNDQQQNIQNNNQNQSSGLNNEEQQGDNQNQEQNPPQDDQQDGIAALDYSKPPFAITLSQLENDLKLTLENPQNSDSLISALQSANLKPADLYFLRCYLFKRNQAASPETFESIDALQNDWMRYYTKTVATYKNSAMPSGPNGGKISGQDDIQKFKDDMKFSAEKLQKMKIITASATEQQAIPPLVPSEFQKLQLRPHNLMVKQISKFKNNSAESEFLDKIYFFLKSYYGRGEIDKNPTFTYVSSCIFSSASSLDLGDLNSQSKFDAVIDGWYSATVKEGSQLTTNVEGENYSSRALVQDDLRIISDCVTKLKEITKQAQELVDKEQPTGSLNVLMPQGYNRPISAILGSYFSTKLSTDSYTHLLREQFSSQMEEPQDAFALDCFLYSVNSGSIVTFENSGDVEAGLTAWLADIPQNGLSEGKHSIPQDKITDDVMNSVEKFAERVRDCAKAAQTQVPAESKLDYNAGPYNVKSRSGERLPSNKVVTNYEEQNNLISAIKSANLEPADSFCLICYNHYLSTQGGYTTARAYLQGIEAWLTNVVNTVTSSNKVDGVNTIPENTLKRFQNDMKRSVAKLMKMDVTGPLVPANYGISWHNPENIFAQFTLSSSDDVNEFYKALGNYFEEVKSFNDDRNFVFLLASFVYQHLANNYKVSNPGENFIKQLTNYYSASIIGHPLKVENITSRLVTESDMATINDVVSKLKNIAESIQKELDASKEIEKLLPSDYQNGRSKVLRDYFGFQRNSSSQYNKFLKVKLGDIPDKKVEVFMLDCFLYSVNSGGQVSFNSAAEVGTAVDNWSTRLSNNKINLVCKAGQIDQAHAGSYMKIVPRMVKQIKKCAQDAQAELDKQQNND